MFIRKEYLIFMNKIMYDIIITIFNNKRELTQRELSKITKTSLGVINVSLKKLIEYGYLTNNKELTEKAIKEIHSSKTRNAIILAAGYGMRMVPINTEIPKGLLEVKNEVLIERIIKQLQEVGITNIQIIVGFMKEKYEYLIDKYNVELIINPKYSERNNLYSLNLAKKNIGNSYIIPCDIYCKENPFHTVELYSWYMLNNEKDEDSILRINKKFELTKVNTKEYGNKMIGIAYISEKDKKLFVKTLEECNNLKKYKNSYWEDILLQENTKYFKPNLVNNEDYIEINTYEELRDFDFNSNSLNNDAIEIIKEVFKVDTKEIVNIQILKKGMTNKSFIFECQNQKYIMRIPGEGTDQLINRKQEAATYLKIKNQNICDDIYYINPENGYKITKFIEGAKVCNPHNQEDIKKCMKKLRDFHNLKLKVEHKFDIFKQIDYFELLWNGNASVYEDYETTKKNVRKLKPFIEKNVESRSLTHIDAVPDNFLITKNEIKLIDWEYAGMQDPHVDIAMFCIYSLYDKEEIDNLISIYFKNKCKKITRLKIYAYISACGLLWSNWCEFKRNLGIEFGEYSIKQYRYAKDFYKIVAKELEEEINE